MTHYPSENAYPIDTLLTMKDTVEKEFKVPECFSVYFEVYKEIFIINGL